MSEINEVQAPAKPTISEKLGKVSLAVGTFALTAPAFAALDVTPLTSEVSGNSASMQTVMLAVLTLLALFVGYKMIKRSLS